MSLKEGYRPSKKQDLKVAKKKPNLLDKMPAKKTFSSSGGSKESSPSPPASPSPASLAISAATTQKVEELMSELNKLKAIILKHEVRIRDLEKKVEESASDSQHHNSQTNNGESLLADEV